MMSPHNMNIDSVKIDYLPHLFYSFYEILRTGSQVTYPNLEHTLSGYSYKLASRIWAHMHGRLSSLQGDIILISPSKIENEKDVLFSILKKPLPLK